MGERKVMEKIVLAFQEFVDTYGVDYIATRAELIYFVHNKYAINESSIIPSDYCYNRINDGITLSKPTLFEYLGRSNYRCLGENHPYTGDIYHKKQIVGICQNGERKVFAITDKPAHNQKKSSQKGGKEINL